MFNAYIWKTYLNAGGSEIVSLFESSAENNYADNYPDRIAKLHTDYCPSPVITKQVSAQLMQLNKDMEREEYPAPCYYAFADLKNNTEYSLEELIEKLYDGFKNDEFCTDRSIFEAFSVDMAYYTTLLFWLFPELFIPYYFVCNFNLLNIIANEFGILFPELPVKKDYKGRFLYYAELCKVFYDFRDEFNLSPYELCAFLYDFAPKYVGGIDSYIIKDLPLAKGAYFIGGTKDDVFLSEDTEIITPWQCNPETLAGDNIVMYLKSPVSAIDSIWRSVSIGFNDPFFFYYRCTYIANPQKIKRVSQKQLEEDIITKELPIIRKNMQGLNGVELLPSAYNRILKLAESDLPPLEFWGSTEANDLCREKDVENQLVKPFLHRLGYSDNEYVQQLHIEIGNHNHMLIPDFVIHPMISRGHHSCEFIIEAKYSVKSQKELEEYKKQARSYANQLKAKYSIIASKEGIWVSAETDDYDTDFFAFSWDQLEDGDTFYRVMRILGNGNVLKSANTRRKLNGRAAEYMLFTEDE